MALKAEADTCHEMMRVKRHLSLRLDAANVKTEVGSDVRKAVLAKHRDVFRN